MWKKLGLGACAFVLIAVGAFLFASRDRAPTHEALIGADLAPMIGVGEFYADRGGEWDYAPSVDARYVAYRAVKGSQVVIRVKRLEDSKVIMTIDQPHHWFGWHQSEPHLQIIAGRTMWKIDPQNPAKANWEDITPKGFRHWQFAGYPLKNDTRRMFVSNDVTGMFWSVYSTALDGSDRQLVEQNDDKTLFWMFDINQKAILRLDAIDPQTKALMGRSEGSWVELDRFDADEILTFLEHLPEENAVLSLSSRGRDTQALVKVDLTTGVETVVYENSRVDVGGMVNLATNDQKVDLVLLQDGLPESIAYSKRGAALKELIERDGGPVYFELTGMSNDGQYVTVARSLKEQSFEYFLYDLDAKTQTLLGEYSLRKYKGEFAQTQAFSVTARDGVEIPVYLTMPKGVDGPVPLIVEAHGGPAQRVWWGYDHDRQFLANRGYAVLAVNFRGSLGYGKEFQALGYGEYGAKMQDDLVDAARWAVEQGFADPQALGIMGASYGGYAAARAVTRDPDLFKAAIIEHAMLDVEDQTRFHPASWGLQLGVWTNYFGSTDSPDDVAVMKKRSPVNFADQVTAPVLIIAGRKDRVVNVYQTERFVEALEANGKDVTPLIFDDQGHGLRHWQPHVLRARAIEDFLAEHLGGRTGGYDYMQTMAKVID